MSENLEIEVKILDIDKEEISSKIEKLWWKLEFLNKPFKSVEMNNNDDVSCRVREEWDIVKVEYKEFLKSDWWAKKAIETGFSAFDYDAIVAFFEKIGFVQTYKNVKKRTSYLLELDEWVAHIDIDEYSDLDWIPIPAFIEIEATSMEIIKKVANLLWYSRDDFKNWWPWELKENYKK
jgi:adenylate cyclase class IV